MNYPLIKSPYLDGQCPECLKNQGEDTVFCDRRGYCVEPLSICVGPICVRCGSRQDALKCSSCDLDFFADWEREHQTKYGSPWNFYRLRV